MDFNRIIDYAGFDIALEALRVLPQQKDETVRELLIQLAEPATIVCVDKRFHNALGVAKEYPSTIVDVERLKNERTLVTTLAWSCKYAADRYAAWAVANVLFPSNLSKVAVAVAENAAKAVAYDAVAEAQKNWQEVFEKTIAAHRLYQERVFRNWLSAHQID